MLYGSYLAHDVSQNDSRSLNGDLGIKCEVIATSECITYRKFTLTNIVQTKNNKKKLS